MQAERFLARLDQSRKAAERRAQDPDLPPSDSEDAATRTYVCKTYMMPEDLAGVVYGFRFSDSLVERFEYAFEGLVNLTPRPCGRDSSRCSTEIQILTTLLCHRLVLAK